MFALFWGWLKFRAAISPRADVDAGAWLSIGPKSRISSFVKIRSEGGRVSIGANTDIGVSTFIGGGDHGVSIGSHCLVSPHCWIGSAGYGVPREIDVICVAKQGSITINDNVWIGAGVTILDNVAIGAGAIISPNSVVMADVPPNAIVQGNPAKTIFIRR